MSKYSYGVKKIEMGAIANDGGMGQTLTDVGEIYQNTCDLQQEDPKETEHYSEQSDDPFLIIAQKGKSTLKFTLVDVTPDTMALFLGGTVTGTLTEAWNAPATVPAIEKSFKITTENNNEIDIIRGKLRAKINWNLARTEVAKIDCVVTVLTPTKAATAPIIITPAA